MDTSEQPHVLIVGAGATGLLIAQGLKRAGIRATVFERQTEEKYHERAGTWNMALHWALPNVEACLPAELYANLKSTENDPWADFAPDFARSIPMLDGKTGEILTHVKAEGPRRVVRGRLRNLFQTGIDIQFGMELFSFDVRNDHVLASFNEGTKIYQGTYLIGCDGARSKVRSYLVDPEANILSPCEITLLFFDATFTASQSRWIRDAAPHPIATLAPHPEQPTYFFLSLGDVPDPTKPETWKWQICLSIWKHNDLESNEERMRAFKHYGSKYCEPFKSIVEWVKEDTKIPHNNFYQWKKIEPWSNYGGRVTIAGDAAHPMVPFRAQGLNNALEDAGHYVRVMKAVTSGRTAGQGILLEYDEDVYKRGKKEIETSGRQMYACHHWDVLMESPLLIQGFSQGKDTSTEVLFSNM